MKKTIFVVWALLFVNFAAVVAQTAPMFPYQAVVRNASNRLVQDSTFIITIQILQETEVKYSESREITTDRNGMVSFYIGNPVGRTSFAGAIADVTDWSKASFQQIFQLSSGDLVLTDPVAPVPYALQAANAVNGVDITQQLAALQHAIDSLSHVIEQQKEDIQQLSDDLYDNFRCDTDMIRDYEGYKYHTVKIGNQCWMKENLRVTHYSDGTPIPHGTTSSDQIAYWYYPDNDAENVEMYGLLYNWRAVVRDVWAASNLSGAVKGICPDGWHVPSVDEWDQLIDFVGNIDSCRCDELPSNIAKALASTEGWEYDSGDACVPGVESERNNATGFSATPAGGYLNDSYSELGRHVYYWSSTVGIHADDEDTAHNLSFDFRQEDVTLSFFNQKLAASVRCVRD